MNNLISYSHYPNLGDCFETKDDSIEKFINAVQSYLGILNNELWFKMYDEYRKNSSVYDMNHNKSMLLKAQVIRLAKQCTCLTNDPESYLSLIDSYVNPDKFIKSLYPVFPVENMDRLKIVYNKLSPYFSKRSATEAAQLYKHWDNGNVLLFYADWYNLINKYSVAKDFYVERLTAILCMVDPGNLTVAQNTLDRFYDTIIWEEPIPKTSFLRDIFLFLKSFPR